MIDGGSAFPQPMFRTLQQEQDWPDNGWGKGGLTMRDYFAAHVPMSALGGEEGRSCKEGASLLGIKLEDYVADVHFPMLLAKAAYRYADAMLAARNT